MQRTRMERKIQAKINTRHEARRTIKMNIITLICPKCRKAYEDNQENKAGCPHCSKRKGHEFIIKKKTLKQ